MDFKDWFNKELANDKHSAVYIASAKRGYEAGQQSKQAEIDALKQQNQRLAMRLDVIQGALQKQIDLIVELKNDT